MGAVESVVGASANRIIKVAALCGSLHKAPLKNAIDWASRPPNCWADKAAAIISTGGDFGGGQSQYHLRQIGVFLDLHFINKPKFFIKAFESPAKFDSEGNLIDPQAKERLKEVLLSLYAFTLRLKEELTKSMAKNVTARIYNGTGHEINLVEKFSWCGNFAEQPPIRISSGEVGVFVLQCPPENPNALGGAVVYRNKATASDVMVAFDNPEHGIPTMTTTRIREENYFAGKKNEIHDILWADRTKFAEDKADIISMTSITQDWQATCMAVLGPRI